MLKGTQCLHWTPGNDGLNNNNPESLKMFKPPLGDRLDEETQVMPCPEAATGALPREVTCARRRHVTQVGRGWNPGLGP